MKLSVVLPLFNEERIVARLLERLTPVLQGLRCEYEVLFVNDGSSDRTLELLVEATRADPRLKLISFGRNYGHQIAITAGLDYASGDAVIVMDADLQDPPELIAEMVALYRQGFDVVSPQRRSRESDGRFKRVTATFFYWLMRRAVHPRLLPEVGDFRLFSRPVLAALQSFREQHRFLRGIVASLGFREAIIPFDRHARADGESKYPLWGMLRLAWMAITSFSGMPLRATLVLGLGLTGVGMIYLCYTLYAALILHEVVRGWTSLVVLQCTFSGTTLIAVGLVGDYVARIYEEVKRRPLYIITQTMNLEPVEPGVALSRTA